MNTPEYESKKTIFSTKAKVVIGVYLFGCALLYFGVPESLMEFSQKRQWTYKPETDIVPSLFDAAAYLARPFLAVVVSFWSAAVTLVCTWYLGMPVGVILIFLFICSDGLIQRFRRPTNRDE